MKSLTVVHLNSKNGLILHVTALWLHHLVGLIAWLLLYSCTLTYVFIYFLNQVVSISSFQVLLLFLEGNIVNKISMAVMGAVAGRSCCDVAAEQHTSLGWLDYGKIILN